MPQSLDEWEDIASKFEEKWNFPMCVGAIDGKHIRIKPPANSGSTFYNYKHTFSVVLMAVVDADCNFIYCDVGANGRVSDGGVFAACSFNKALESNLLKLPEVHNADPSNMSSYHFLADDAFPLRNKIMKPYSGRKQSLEQKIFNYRLSRARRVVENAFGIIANRFRIFLSAIPLPPEKVENVVMAACSLHNYLSKIGDNRYVSSGLMDTEDEVTHVVTPGRWRCQPYLQSARFQHNNNPKVSAKLKRDSLRDYFCSEGQVDWQWRMV